MRRNQKHTNMKAHQTQKQLRNKIQMVQSLKFKWRNQQNSKSTITKSQEVQPKSKFNKEFSSTTIVFQSPHYLPKLNRHNWHEKKQEMGSKNRSNAKQISKWKRQHDWKLKFIFWGRLNHPNITTPYDALRAGDIIMKQCSGWILSSGILEGKHENRYPTEDGHDGNGIPHLLSLTEGHHCVDTLQYNLGNLSKDTLML